MNSPKPSDIFPSRRPGDAERSARLGTGSAEIAFVEPPEVTTDEATLARRADTDCDNPELPIMAYLERISEAVASNPFTIIRGETGSGKSTQVCQYLAAEDEYDEVIVTQPRRLMVRTLAKRVAEEIQDKYGEEFDGFVGYKMRGDHTDTPDAAINFVTNGYQEVVELTRHNRVPGQERVVIVDEAHETSIANEVLLALLREEAERDPDLRVVVMSATVDTKSIANYLGNGKYEVPVIDVPGRQYEREIHEGGDTYKTIQQLAQAGKKGMVAVAGKPEIDKVTTWMTERGISTKILPLHGELDKQAQDLVMKDYPEGLVIVATNVAQTGLTIPGLDWVIDTGEEKRKEVVNGVEGLRIRPRSRSSCMQWAGRTGRQGKGEYHLTHLPGRPFVGLGERDEFDTPEIMRVHLDGLVLQLARNGHDIEKMRFRNQPPTEAIARAKRRLTLLGALDDNNKITPIGRDMEKMSVEARYGRMMIEARKYPESVQKQLALAIAIQEVGGITQKSGKSQKRWQSLLDGSLPADSDVLKELEVYLKAQSMNRTERKEYDLLVRNMGQVHGVLSEITRAERIDWRDIDMPTLEEREQLLRCIIAGMADGLYVRKGREYIGADGEIREFARESLASATELIVGEPFDIEWTKTRENRYGGVDSWTQTTKIVRNITSIPDIAVLREIAPQLFTEKRSGFIIRENGTIAEQWAQLFNTQDTGTVEIRESQPSEDRKDFIIDQLLPWGSRETPYTDIIEEISRLQRKTPEPLMTITPSDMRGMLELALPLEVSTLEEARQYWPEVVIDDVVPAEVRARIDEQYPDEVHGVELVYQLGKPFISNTISPEDLLTLFGDKSTCIPSGQEIIVRLSPYESRPLSAVLAEEREAQVRHKEAAENKRLDQEGAEQGLPANVEIWRRLGGATRRGNGWVICADGSLREADDVPVDRYGRYEHPDGVMRWGQIRPGELVLRWGKADVVSEHDFTVVHMPPEGVTDKQRATAQNLQDKITEDWSIYDDRKYDPRGDRSSPPVGQGWGLSPESIAMRERVDELKVRVIDAEDVLRELIGEDILPENLQKQMNRLVQNIDTLADEYYVPRNPHEYENQLKSVLSQLEKLKTDVRMWQQSQSRTGVASDDMLQALAAKFNR